MQGLSTPDSSAAWGIGRGGIGLLEHAPREAFVILDAGVDRRDALNRQAKPVVARSVRLNGAIGVSRPHPRSSVNEHMIPTTRNLVCIEVKHGCYADVPRYAKRP